MSAATPADRKSAAPAERWAPADAEAMAEAVRRLGERGLAARVRGAGTERPRDLGSAPADILLSTQALSGIDELDEGEAVARVAAGTPLAALEDAARSAGLHVPLDPPAAASTAGGALSAAALGPRCLGYGPARDQVLGLDVVLGSGERTRCGGRVVKNVTGYDLAKLYVGSRGTLCVITHAWLRLRPLPETVQTLAAPLAGGEAALADALAAARLPGVRAAVLADGSLLSAHGAGSGLPAASAGGFLLLVELACEAAVASQSAAVLVSRHGAAEVSQGSVDALAALEGAEQGPPTAWVRIAARPSRLAAAYAPLRAAGASLVTHPGLGLLCAGFAAEPESRDAGKPAALGACEAAVRAGEGSATLVSAPDPDRWSADVFSLPPARLALMRRLKAQLDPKGVLNPGVLVGGR